MSVWPQRFGFLLGASERGREDHANGLENVVNLKKKKILKIFTFCVQPIGCKSFIR